MDSFEINKKNDSRDVRKNQEEERDLFNKAREFVSSSYIFRLAANYYSERKLMVFIMAWLCAVAVVYTHFAIKTGNHGSPTARAAKLGDWWIYKYFPMIEAGGVNAILSIISLLPLTMCRFTISKLSDTFPALFVPLNRLRRVHIFFAYLWMVIAAFLIPIFIEGPEDFRALERVTASGRYSALMIGSYFFRKPALVHGVSVTMSAMQSTKNN